jgi:hypothetical protein
MQNIENDIKSTRKLQDAFGGCVVATNSRGFSKSPKQEITF